MSRFDLGYFDRVGDELRIYPRRRLKNLSMAVTGILGACLFICAAVVAGSRLAGAACPNCAGAISASGTGRYLGGEASLAEGGRWRLSPQGTCGADRLFRVSRLTGERSGEWAVVDASGRLWPLGEMKPGGSATVRLPAGVDVAALHIGAIVNGH